MSIKKISLKTKVNDTGKRLDHFLFESLNQAGLSQALSKSKIRTLIIAGAVYSNGKRIRIASKPMSHPSRIEVYFDEAKLFSKQFKQNEEIFQMSPELILYQDEWLLLANKPPKLPTQATLDEARNNFFESLKKYLNEEKSISYLGLHHRLDRDTSGIMLFTTSREANFGVSELFKKHEIQKSYLALCWNPERKILAKTWEIKNHLGRLNKKGKQNRFGSVHSGGDRAHTRFQVQIESSKQEFVLIEAQPLTGRTHQIRVHLSEYGLPILGDMTYGFKSELIPEKWKADLPNRTLLHASQLEFIHPILKKHTQVHCPPPEDFKKAIELFFYKKNV